MSLIKSDPVTCVRYFHFAFHTFLTMFLQNNLNQIGSLQDYFYRIEFQQRGSPHVHMLVWIEDAPSTQHSTLEDIARKYVPILLSNASNEEK